MELFKIIPADYALKNLIVPLSEGNNSVKIAMANPEDYDLLNELQFLFNKNIITEKWDQAAIEAEINKMYQLSNGVYESGDNGHYKYVEKKIEGDDNKNIPKVEDHSVINLVNDFISQAIQKKASDIHVESYESEFRIRFRLDGKLVVVLKPPPNKKQAIISRLKIMANMDIAEKRRPQDGRIRMQNNNRSVDIRVSTLPTDFGEKIVLRILDKASVKLSLEALGFERAVLEKFKQILKMPYGMILVTGPTGSGKTTTLYSALNFLNQPDVNIITIEDPIEYNLDGINQTMVRADIGLSFASILRTILRQDPNIIMVGEIRDAETAEIAIRSALTGHLVLSTLHTNDAVSTIIRLMDMGIEPFLVATSVKMVIAQRLIRKICPNCKKEVVINWEDLAGYQLPEKLKSHTFYQGSGCSGCNQTGFSGREALIEPLIIDGDYEGLILKNAGLNELRRLAKSKGLLSLTEVGFQKAIAEKTTLGEVIHETMMI